MMTAIGWTVFSLAAVPAALFCVNLFFYRRLPAAARGGQREPVSVLVPARNEAASIGECIASVCDQEQVEVEMLVGDDSSTDGTAKVVESWAARDPRVELVRIPALPPGWCGKQHACSVLAARAGHDVLVFIDADVRLEPDSLFRLCRAARAGPAALLSGFPRQVTRTCLEILVLPLMHFLLLGYLPMVFMRRSTHPAFGAGCGQLFVTRRSAYEKAGGHAAVRASRHDGITLPRAYRRAGLLTDLCDATDLARCRMYRTGKQVWFGLAKNATEGLARARAIVPWSVILLGGQTLPAALLLVMRPAAESSSLAVPLIGATALSYLPRVVASLWFRQSLAGAVCHPLGVAILVAIQWFALARELRGQPASWKGRSYEVAAAGERSEDVT